MTKKVVLTITLLSGACAILLGTIMLHVANRYAGKIVLAPNLIEATDSSDSAHVAIVFGAGIKSDGMPSDALADRILTAADLYAAGIVRKILMSGDNSYVNYNEPEVMKNYAVDQGVPEKDIVLDYGGRRTYDTCYRAKHVFSLDSAILVTQAFHLNRALYLCNELGIDSIGVTADRHTYLGSGGWAIREWLARINAWFDIQLKAKPEIGGEKVQVEW